MPPAYRSPGLPPCGSEILRSGRVPQYPLSVLGESDSAVLDFESSWWLHPGPKDRAIRVHLGISATSYYQVLRRLVEDPDAMQHDPLTVKRLQRVRMDASRRAAERQVGGGDGTKG